MAPGSHAHEDRGPLELTEAARIEEEEEEDCFESIDKLISQGISVRDVKKLQDAGIYTCNGLMMHTKKSLTGIKVLSEAKVERICQAAENLLSQRSQEGNDLQIKGAVPFTSYCNSGSRGEARLRMQSNKGHTNTSVVTEFDSDLRPLPADVMDNLEPFALLVRLIARAFYSDVGIEKGEIKTGCNSNCGIAVVVLDKLTRYAWISENKLARLLKIKEKTMFVLLEFLEKERFLQRENTERKQVKIDDDTSNAHDRQKFGDNEYDTLSIPPGLYCCLDYSQVYDVVRYRLHLMKESLKDKIDPGNKLEQQIEEYFCRNCKKRYSALDAMHLLSSSGGTLCCEICKHELVAGNDIDGPRKERRKTFADMLARMKVQLRPLEEQLKMLKDLSVPKFGTLKEWREKNVVEYIAETKVESSNTFPEEVGAESSSNFPGSKVLPLWIIRKGMALKQAEKGSSHDDRQVGIKSKRAEGGSGDNDDNAAEFGGSTRRKMY